MLANFFAPRGGRALNASTGGPGAPEYLFAGSGGASRGCFRTLAFIIAAGSAGLFFGQPNRIFHLPFLALLYPFCLHYLACAAPTGKSAVQRCFLLGLAGNSSTLYWLVYPMHNVAGMSFALAAPLVLLLCAYLAIYPMLFGAAVRGARRLVPASGAIAGALAAPLLCGAAYGGFEALCGVIFSGFPWLSLSSSFAFRPVFVQAAHITGAYGLSALFAACACLASVSAGAVHPGPFRAGARPRLAALFLCLAILSLLYYYGRQRLDSPATVENEGRPELEFAMIQGNIDQNQKWDPAFLDFTVERHTFLTRQALDELAAESGAPAGEAEGRSAETREQERSGQKIRLVIWPETAMPFYFPQQRERGAELARFAAENKIHLAFGSLGGEYRDSGRPAIFNRFNVLSPSGKLSGYYDKEHLVPFGEYVPFAALMAIFNDLLQGMDFSPGKRDEPVIVNFYGTASGEHETGNSQTRVYPEKALPGQSLSLGVLICYEAIFPELAQKRTENGAQILINVSNDAWFGKSSAPLQHLSMTAMRAVEQARPVLRATNTGISALIDSRGRIIKRGKNLFDEETLTGTVAPSLEKTIYHRLFPYQEICLAALALLSLLGYKFR